MRLSLFSLIHSGNSFLRAPAHPFFLVAMCLLAAYAAKAAEITVPQQVTAGKGLTIPTTGDGNSNSEATFYLIGPAHVAKRTVKPGEPIHIAPEELRTAGRYLVVLGKGDGAGRASFYVTADKPANINFLARPSRVPAARSGVISGVAFVFDAYNNFVITPTPVKFNLAVEGAAPATRVVKSHNGIAWTRLDSGRKAGAAQFVVSVGQNSVRRVVQHVAADACNLRLKAHRSKDAIVVETDPVRDCAGNPVPDGTIVTFIAVGPKGRSTVDARVKRGIARAELPATERATISVAAGVVMGNEITVGGGQ
jgi:hypothetical protein